jgi:hypothetical protein
MRQLIAAQPSPPHESSGSLEVCPSFFVPGKVKPEDQSHTVFLLIRTRSSAVLVLIVRIEFDVLV